MDRTQIEAEIMQVALRVSETCEPNSLLRLSGRLQKLFELRELSDLREEQANNEGD